MRNRQARSLLRPFDHMKKTVDRSLPFHDDDDEDKDDDDDLVAVEDDDNDDNDDNDDLVAVEDDNDDKDDNDDGDDDDDDHDDQPLTDADEALRLRIAIARQPKRAPPLPVFKSEKSLSAVRMTQTEASLRLAISLLERRLTTSDVEVALTGGELTRKNKDYFPVRSFLRAQGFDTVTRGRDWRDTYTSDQTTFALVLHKRLGRGDVVTTLADGRRFAAEVCGGPLTETRSSTEHRLLRGVIARALTAEYAEPNDLMVAIVPRSERFRALAKRWRELPRVANTGIAIALIDRIGTIDGCAEIDCKPPASNRLKTRRKENP